MLEKMEWLSFQAWDPVICHHSASSRHLWSFLRAPPLTGCTSASLPVQQSVYKHIHLKEIRDKKTEGAKDISYLLNLKLYPLFMAPLKFAYWEELE